MLSGASLHDLFPVTALYYMSLFLCVALSFTIVIIGKVVLCAQIALFSLQRSVSVPSCFDSSILSCSEFFLYS